MMRYAQINTNSICIAVSNLKGEVTAAHMIPIADDANPIGKKWENGTWNDVATPITYRTINKMEAIKLVITHAGMDAAAEEAMYDDPNLSLLWKRWNNWVPYDDINRDKPDVAEFLGGLIAAGHMTQAQVDALMADWPKVGG
jgi:hypothetical protein